MKRSQKWLLTIVALQAINGLVAPQPALAGALILVVFLSLAIATPVAIYSWCQADIAERNLQYPAGAPILVGVIPPLGVPLYFLRTRSLLGAVAGMGKSILFVILALTASWIGAYLRMRVFA